MFFRLVHSSEFRGKLDNYTFVNTTYPWEIYEGTFRQLGDPIYHRDRALLLEHEEPFFVETFYDTELGMPTRFLNQEIRNYILILKVMCY